MKELILALDVEERRIALKIAEEISDLIDRFKVNYPLILSSGIKIIPELSEMKPVIADLKIADVPHISSKIAEIAFRNDANAVITHGFIGSDSLRAILDIAKRFGGEVYVVTELSSPGGEEFMSRVSIEIAKRAKEIGLNGLIAPATRIERLKEIRAIAERMKILCPGIGAQGGNIEALRYADGIIVGRSIYEAENPREEAKKLREYVQAYSV
ncbi:MAG: orotidine-5'-phosphate decarboxylase [Archaeoglobaceae archaeon]|nr:orotidine-5'-phosphate decarboxylase [Archaeoglobaceae archaeon]MDW8117946.1 orotidine-5'-phosphate decarboxylase [Archaeoglobaceae archaeon]